MDQWVGTGSLGPVTALAAMHACCWRLDPAIRPIADPTGKPYSADLNKKPPVRWTWGRARTSGWLDRSILGLRLCWKESTCDTTSAAVGV